MNYLGIDISDNNGLLNWDKIKSQDIDFVMIRIGFGSDILSQDDKQAERNMNECERLNIPYGVYLYSYALNMDELQSEIKHMERMIKNRNPQMGIAFDMEDADGYKEKHGLKVFENKELLTNMCNTFCQYFDEKGYKTFVYANFYYFSTILNEINYPKWLAHWGISEPSLECAMWQYASDGNIEGSSSRTDMNYYYGELPIIENNENNKEEDIITNENEQQEDSSLKVGSKVRVINAKQYNGNPFTAWYDVYDVIEVDGDRIVIGINDAITTAINVNNLELIETNINNLEEIEEDLSENDGSIYPGDRVRFIGTIDYNGTPISAWHNDEGYIVSEVKNNRVVLTYNQEVFAAVNIKDIELF